jgi:hypothetical protein
MMSSDDVAHVLKLFSISRLLYIISAIAFGSMELCDDFSFFVVFREGLVDLLSCCDVLG